MFHFLGVKASNTCADLHNDCILSKTHQPSQPHALLFHKRSSVEKLRLTKRTRKGKKQAKRRRRRYLRASRIFFPGTSLHWTASTVYTRNSQLNQTEGWGKVTGPRDTTLWSIRRTSNPGDNFLHISHLKYAAVDLIVPRACWKIG